MYDKSNLPLDPAPAAPRLTVTMDGWSRIEEIKTSGRSLTQCFVAMAFKKDTDAIWTDVIEPASTTAGSITSVQIASVSFLKAIATKHCVNDRPDVLISSMRLHPSIVTVSRGAAGAGSKGRLDLSYILAKVARRKGDQSRNSGWS